MTDAEFDPAPVADGDGSGVDREAQLVHLASLFWRQADAAASESREQRLRSASGDLADAVERVHATLQSLGDRDDMLLALVHTRRNDTSDLEFLGAGVVEDLWHDGDEDLLPRLRHNGVAAAIVVLIDSAMWK